MMKSIDAAERLSSGQDKNSSGSDFTWLSVVIIAVLLVMLPVLYWGIPSGHDLKHHFQCAMVFYNSLLDGNFIQHWSANVNHGFGDVGARLYPPIGYYVLALARMLTGNWYNAGQAAFVFWMLLGAAGMFAWARSCRLSPPYSALAAVLYATAPYHLARVYQLFLYAEFAAASILPFCFLFAVRIIREEYPGGRTNRRRQFNNIIGLAISLGLLALTHIPLTLIATGGIILYALLAAGQPFWKSPKVIVRIASGLFLGLLAAAWQWIKIITEMGWVNIGVEPAPEKYLYYKNHFFPLYLSTRENWYTARQLFLIDTMVVLTLLIILAPLAAVLIWRYRKSRAANTNLPGIKNGREVTGNLTENLAGPSPLLPPPEAFDSAFYNNLKALTIIGLAAFFLITIPSKPIWQILPILQKIQFPWRWLSLATIAGTLGMSAGLEYLLRGDKKTAGITRYVAITLLTIVGIFNISQTIIPLAPVERSEFDAEMSVLPEEQSLIDWWTIWARGEALSDERKAVVDSAREVKIVNWSGEEREFDVRGAAGGESPVLRVATFYYPYWQAEINGAPAAVSAGRDGTINLKVPPGDSTVKLFFREPLPVKAALLVSGLVWIFLLGAAAGGNLLSILSPRRQNSRQRAANSSWRLAGA